MSSHSDRSYSPISDRSVSPPSFTEPVLSIGHPSSGHPSLPNDSSAGTTSHDPHNGLKVENIAQTLCVERGKIQAQGQSPGHVITINYLPDDVLLEIFNSCRKDHNPDQSHTPVWRWDGLVHVCQRWRQLVFGSPRRLDLQLLCTNGTRVLENLDCWPPLPIAVQYLNQDLVSKTFTPDDKDSLFAALWNRDRIRHVDLGLTGPQLAEVATVMQESFPALTHVSLQRTDGDPPTLPNDFLGGSAPYLQHLVLDSILFPALFKLLSSTSNLVDLYLEEIPPWIQGDLISPEAMVACLAGLPRLKLLFIGFISTTFHVDPIRSPPETQIFLPALTSFRFQGASRYLEELISRIDSPQLNKINIAYSYQLFDFQVTQLLKFVDRSKAPGLTLIKHANVHFSHRRVSFEMYPCPESRFDRDRISALVDCQGVQTQVSHLAQVFSQPSAMLSRVVHLKLSLYPANALEDRHDDEWLDLLRQFSAVRTLHVSGEFAGLVALVLEDITGDMVAEVLPFLDLIYLDGQPVSSVGRFLAARQLSDHPVAIINTEVEFYQRVKSYVSD